MVCSCGTKVSENDYFCRECGRKLRCPKCGAAIYQDSSFCTQCGESLSMSSSEEEHNNLASAKTNSDNSSYNEKTIVQEEIQQEWKEEQLDSESSNTFKSKKDLIEAIKIICEEESIIYAYLEANQTIKNEIDLYQFTPLPEEPVLKQFNDDNPYQFAGMKFDEGGKQKAVLNILVVFSILLIICLILCYTSYKHISGEHVLVSVAICAILVALLEK